MADKSSDQRKFSGDRVVARCEVVMESNDPFSLWDNVKTGHMVLNVRGGCLYLDAHVDELTVEKIFPYDGSGKFIKLTLSADNRPDVVLENLQVSYQRLRLEANREGIVFRFVDITEKQLDLLGSLGDRLPKIGNREVASVPFEKLFKLDTSYEVESSRQGSRKEGASHQHRR